MPFLRQSTIQSVRFGPFLDATDGVTEETALTITQALRRLSKDGGAFAQTGTTGNATHDSDGWYSANLSAADTDTIGELILNVQDPANHLPVWMRWYVVEESVYDSMFASASVGPATVAAIADAVLDEDMTAHQTTGTLGQAIGDPGANTKTLYAALIDDAVGASVTADVATVDTVVDGIQTDLDNATDGLGAIKTAVDGVQADLDNGTDGLGAIKAETALILTDTGTTLDTKLNDIQGATFSSATDSLEAIRDRGDAAWTTGAGGSNPFVLQTTTIATLASQTSFTLTAGSADNDAYNNCLAIIEDSATAVQKAVGVISDYVGGTLTITLREDPAIFTMAVGDTIDIVAISPDVANILVDTETTIPAQITALNDPTVAQIADAVLDEDMTAHQTLGSLGQAIGDPASNTKTLYAALITDAVGASVTADVATVDTVVDGIQTDLSNGTDGLGAIKSDTTAILTDTGTTLDTKLNDIQGATFSSATDSLEAIRNRGDAAWITHPVAATGTADSGSTTTVVDAARTEADTDYWKGSWIHFTSGNIAGQTRLITGFTPGTDTITFAPATTQAVTTQDYDIVNAADIDTVNTLTGHTPQTQDHTADLTAILADTNELQLDDIPGLIAALNDIAATDIVSAGAITTLAGAVVNVDLVDLVTANTDMRGTDSAALASVCTEARLSELDAAIGGKMANQVDIIEADTTSLNDTKIPDTISLANINAEMVDVIDTDTSGEPAQAGPPVTASLRAKLDWLYKVFRNKKEQTATSWSLYNDAGTTIDSKATVSDDGTTATKEEVVSGP